MKAPRIKQISVRTLHRLLLDGVFAVPKLQREFVWNGSKAAALLDSMYQCMPIGAVLVWHTQPKDYDLLRQVLHILPPFATENPWGWFLIDGQQRLSVLHEAFAGGEKQNSGGQTIDFGRLCFVPEPEKDDGGPTWFVYRKPIHRKYIPIQNILASNWKRLHKNYPKRLFHKIEGCRTRLLRYKIPVVVIHSDDLEEVREVFVRINSQGMKISAADRTFARASQVDLRHLAHELRSGINPEFRDVDFNVILQGFAFVTPERKLDVGERALEATINWWNKRVDHDGQKSEFYSRWGKYRAAFGKAVDYLHSKFSVLHSGFLPSAYMLATLSVFFYHHPAAPSTRQRREIRKWFWSTGVGLRYSGRGYRQNLIADVKFFSRLARHGAARFSFTDRMDRLDVSRMEYTRRSSLSNAFFCLLACHGPCYIANGEPIPSSLYASQANRSDRHHIFPRRLLANHGFKHRDYNSLCNICFIAAEENQQFGMKRPARYLADYFRRRHFARAMKSHLIPYDGNSGLRTSGVRKAYGQFRRRRLDAICRAFEEEAGIKLFRRD